MSISKLAATVISKQKTPEEQIKILQNQCEQLNITLDQFVKALEEKEEEITQLKMIIYKNPKLTGIIMEISDEELIADIQLRKIKEDAKIRKLSLEEVKMFDLLVKNKRLAQGNATTIEKKPSNRFDLSNPQKLLEIASKKIES